MLLKQLNQLVTITKLHSINRAAEALFISQPALSASIKKLEATLGKTLLKRTNKGIFLTPDGEKIYADSIVIQDIIKNWDGRDNAHKISGNVHIVCTPYLSGFISSNLLIPFYEQYPGITLFVHNSRHDLIDRLKNTSTNIAVATVYPQEKILETAALQNWEINILAQDQRRLLMRADHPLASKKQLVVADLKKLRLAWYSDLEDVVFAVFDSFFEHTFRLASRDDCLSLIMCSDAVFCQPYRMYHTDWRMRHGLLIAKQLPLMFEKESLASIAAFHTADLSEAEVAFWNFLTQEFQRFLIP